MRADKVKNHPRPRDVDRFVDTEVNAVFTALTQALGRSFEAGSRNVRSIVSLWCPLLQGCSGLDVESFKQSYISAHFFDRYFYSSELKGDADLEAQALKKFEANLGRGYMQNSWKLKFLPYGLLNSVLKSAEMEIGRVLGELHTEEWFSACRHGPNASVGVRRDEATHDMKCRTIEGTRAALQLYEEYLEWNPHQRSYLEKKGINTPDFKIVTGSKLSFVPKKFDSKRSMMIEPVINQFFQLGLGELIGQRLRRFGNIDISTQPAVHADLVRLTTSHGLELSTLDWSQASDRIWLGLVERLLPSDWFAAIETVRCPIATYKGRDLHLTMAGSMGNGFTFPLQTLIFRSLLLALARECGCSEFVSVFGDDCIVDVDLVPHVTWLAKELDWQLNAEKSFWDGDFRESCGVDSYRGMDVRPFFITRPDHLEPNGLLSWAYAVYNQIAERVSVKEQLDGWFSSFIKGWSRLYSIPNPQSFVCYVPPRFSVNSGIRVHDPSYKGIEGLPSRITGCDRDGWMFPYLRSVPNRIAVDSEPFYHLALSGGGVPQDFKKVYIPLEQEDTSDWPDLTGRVPGKRVSYKVVKTKQPIWTWVYLVN